MDNWVSSSSQFFSYYPKYEYLDSTLSSSGRKKMNLFLDVKGCAQALFQEWAVKHIIGNSKDTITVDTSLFAGILEFIAFHKLYAKKRQIDLKMYFFMESGKSSYHLDIHKEYKAKRGIGDMFGLDFASREFFYQILDKNYHVIDKVTNKIPNVCFIKLNYLEADFIPWYLMNHVLSKEDVDESVNIIYSTDKDMLQCLDASNKFQFYRHSKNIKMLTQKDIYIHWLKEELPLTDPAIWFPMALSIIGDPGDGFNGVGGVGPVNLIKVFEYVMTLCGRSMDNVYNNILKNQKIFNSTYQVKELALQKVLTGQDIVIRNLKLSSYRLLSEAINGGFPTYMTDRKNQILECVNNTYKCSGAGIMIGALNKAGLMGVVKESTVANLF
jgi:hypothetical protein